MIIIANKTHDICVHNVYIMQFETLQSAFILNRKFDDEKVVIMITIVRIIIIIIIWALLVIMKIKKNNSSNRSANKIL